MLPKRVGNKEISSLITVHKSFGLLTFGSWTLRYLFNGFDFWDQHKILHFWYPTCTYLLDPFCKLWNKKRFRKGFRKGKTPFIDIQCPKKSWVGIINLLKSLRKPGRDMVFPWSKMMWGAGYMAVSTFSLLACHTDLESSKPGECQASTPWPWSLDVFTSLTFLV